MNTTLKKSSARSQKVPTIADINRTLDRIALEHEVYVREAKERAAETDRTFKKLFKEVGGISNNNGAFAEEYFTTAFEENKTLGKLHFDDIQTNISVKDRNEEDEYDIVLYNDESIAIIEVKYKAKEHDIDHVVQKADSFRRWFPKYKKYDIYLGLAGLSFQKETVPKAKEKGIAIIRQKGDKLIVNDKYLKPY